MCFSRVCVSVLGTDFLDGADLNGVDLDGADT